MGLSKFILGVFGWRVNDFIPKEDKYILIVAPHTSVWDFVVGKLAFNTKRIPAIFFIKKEFFVFPFGILLKCLGGMPVNRTHASNVVEYTARVMEERKRIAVIITPEGTRKRTEKWKRGFYYLALRTGYPVYAGKVDYDKKECVIMENPIDVNRSFEAVMEDLATLYKGVKGKHPEKFNFVD